MMLRLMADDAPNDGSDYKEFQVDLDHISDRIRFLIDELENGNWDVTDPRDQAKIRRILTEMRKIKYRAIARMGDYGGTSILDWYKALFEIDKHIHNARDLRVEGQKLPEWDPETVIKIIKQAERAKLKFVDKFPWFLGINLAWFYDRLYAIDANLEVAYGLLRAGNLDEALGKLNRVKQIKHDIEEMLETV